MNRRIEDTVKGYIKAHLPWFVSGVFFICLSAVWGWAALKISNPITIYLRNETDHQVFTSHFKDDEKKFDIIAKELDEHKGRLDRDHQEIVEMRGYFITILTELRKK
jgi:hypothetical protein